jgi:hypothetical protein
MISPIRIFLIIYLFSSCSIIRNHALIKPNFFALPFKMESPYAINCSDIENKCDTSFTIPEREILSLIDSRLKKLKVSSISCSDTRIMFKYSNGEMLCIDIGGKIKIRNICYEKDSVILNTFLSYLPRRYY